jgi:CBS domain-containing protein
MATIHAYVTRDVQALDGSTPAREAARLMADRRIGSIAVREAGRITGLVTERDLVETVLARGGDPSMPIRSAMRPGIPRVHCRATEQDAARLMRDHFTRHLLVEDEGEVVGIVSMRDIIALMLEEKQFLIEQLQTYINGPAISTVGLS